MIRSEYDANEALAAYQAKLDKADERMRWALALAPARPAPAPRAQERQDAMERTLALCLASA